MYDTGQARDADERSDTDSIDAVGACLTAQLEIAACGW